MQDAHNLAWKLAMVLRGEASLALLDTYETERLPVGEFTMEQAYARYVTRTAPYLGTAGMQPVAGDLDVELGYVYDSPAICGATPPAHEDPRQSHARPGTRAPHVWLERHGERCSTLDLFDGRFTVLAGRDGAGWCEAAQGAAAALGLTLATHCVDGDALRDPGTDFETAYGIESSGAVLVRPDGFIAWREASSAGVTDARAALTRALRIATGLSAAHARSD
jgi:hypothetical protein